MPRRIINKGIDCFLKHALFIAGNHLGCVQLQQTLQTIVAVDNTAVQIIQVRGGKPAAVKRNHRTEVRGNHRKHRHNHPRRINLILHKTAQQLHAADEFFRTSARCLLDSKLKLPDCSTHVKMLEQFIHRFSANRSVKNMAVFERQLMKHVFGNDAQRGNVSNLCLDFRKFLRKLFDLFLALVFDLSWLTILFCSHAIILLLQLLFLLLEFSLQFFENRYFQSLVDAGDDEISKVDNLFQALHAHVERNADL